MKRACLALLLALTVASWAQTATQNAPATAAPDKTNCCHKKAGAKDGASCPRHGMKNANGKETASCCKDGTSCCAGKDGECCMKDQKASTSCCKDCCSKDKTAAACCGDKCGKDGKCCRSGKSDKTAVNCCAKHQHS